MSVGLLSANTWDRVPQPAQRIIRVPVMSALVAAVTLAGLHFFPGWGEVEAGSLLALKYQILSSGHANCSKQPQYKCSTR